MQHKIKVVTLATVFNRKALTLRSLNSLICACDFADVESQHIIVDDNSADGTSKAINNSFPYVKILHGNGGLFWAGGMRYGFEYINNFLEYDYLVAYNDDCEFTPNSVELLIKGFDSSDDVGIVVGSLSNPNNGTTSYGGRNLRWRSKWLPPSFYLVQPSSSCYIPVDSFNMNLCCISRSTISLIGFLNENFCHSAADYDYGLRANNIGIVVSLAPSTVGTCSLNPKIVLSNQPFKNFLDRLKLIFSKKKYPFKQTLFYYRSHGGNLWFFWLILFYISRLFQY